MAAESNGSRRVILARPLQWLAWLSGLILVGIMGLLTVGVFFRYVLNQPIVGIQELVQLSIVAVVMLAMPHCALRNAHIKVDVFDPLLGPKGRGFGNLFSRLVGIAVLSLLVWKAWLKALDALEYEDVTNMLELPIWPAYAAIAFGMALYAVVLLLELYDQLFNREMDA